MTIINGIEIDDAYTFRNETVETILKNEKTTNNGISCSIADNRHRTAIKSKTGQPDGFL